ncbi:MAG TPA: tetratricopeptide repeat protein [Acidobacteriaceae bacterium]|nr:tetratricopeptide repeat protein [Acidobacteriaceae bacterium]
MIMTAAVMEGFEEELARAEQEIAKLQSRLEQSPGDLQSRVRLAYRMNHRASLSGRMADLEQTLAAVTAAIQEFGPKEDLCLLKANLDAHLHRIANAREDLAMAPCLAGRFEARALLADLDFQEGRYEESRLALEELIRENRTWDNLARLAHWESRLGDPEKADELYFQAEDELTAKQMRSYAWLELERGLLDFRMGRFADARKHYARADESYPGYWHTDEHVAELLGAEDQFDTAAALLLAVIERTHKPELQQALAEIYILTGRSDEAEPWLDKALASYLDSVKRGGVHYLHHLADFYTDVRPDPAHALAWARKDYALRSNFSTQAALARALHLNRKIAEAVAMIEAALSSGVKDAMVYSHAADIFAMAGRAVESLTYADAALQLNPRHGSFHIHH